MSAKTTTPSDFELQILGVLWREGPSTVRQILERLPDGKERAYTSVLSVMQVMEKKGFLDRTAPERGLAHVYRAKVAERKVLGPVLRSLVTRIFGGNSTAAIQQLLSDADVDEIAQVRALLDELEDGHGKKPKRGRS